MKPFSPVNESEIRRLRPWLGTFVEIRVSGETTAAASAVEAGFVAVAEVHRLMSFFDPQSDLSLLNRTPPGRWVALDPAVTMVLKVAEEMERLSTGAFNIAASSGVRGAFETADGHARRLKDARLDLGGIAKGFAVDRAVEAIQRTVVGASGIVNAGGDLRVFGDKPETIHLRAETREEPLLYAISLANAAVATSSRSWGTFSVITRECLWADALTKVAAQSDSAASKLRLESCLEHRGASVLTFDSSGRLLEAA